MLKQLWKTNAPLTFTGLLMLPALAISIVGLLIDPRIITDATARPKPRSLCIDCDLCVHACPGVYADPRMARRRRVVRWRRQSRWWWSS